MSAREYLPCSTCQHDAVSHLWSDGRGARAFHWGVCHEATCKPKCWEYKEMSNLEYIKYIAEVNKIGEQIEKLYS